MEELKFILITPHGTRIKISKRENSPIITLQYLGRKQKITQTFNNVEELTKELKDHIFDPVFGTLS